jgi:hypothetical protein
MLVSTGAFITLRNFWFHCPLTVGDSEVGRDLRPHVSEVLCATQAAFTFATHELSKVNLRRSHPGAPLSSP